jgi:hypothetical protein
MTQETLTWPQMVRRCRYRTLLGPNTGPADAVGMVRAATHTLAILGGEAGPIDPDAVRDLVDVLTAGGTIVIMSDRADLRDAAKAEIVSLTQLAKASVGGCA